MPTRYRSAHIAPVQWMIAALLLTVFVPAIAMAMEEGRPSSTAMSVAAFRAIGARDPDPKVRNPDTMAEKMLGPSYWGVSGLTHFLESMKRGYRPNRLATLHWVTARTLHVDAVLTQAVADGARQVVVLGAGFDSRAYRMRDRMPQVTFFEVDFPATQEAKLNRLKKIFGITPDWVRYAPIDFNTQTLGDVLKTAGYQPSIKTFYIWEGVTYYLDADAVSATLTFIARNSSPGSRVFFDYMHQSVIDGDYRYPHSQRLAAMVQSVGEPWVSGIAPYGADQLVKASGLALVSDLGHKEFTQRYLLDSNGIQIGEPLQFLSLALAEVPIQK